MSTTRATEAECIRTIIDAAKICGWRVHHSRPAMMRSGRWSTPLQGHKGLPDLILVRGRQLWFVEAKRKPNKVEPAQQEWLDALQAAGVATFVVWVPEEMQAFIDELARPVRSVA